MTLVITRLTRFGIAMAADSAVTTRHTGLDGVTRYRAEPSSVEKLLRIPGLQAGISCWGRGTINGADTSEWVKDFISNGGTFPSIQIFAHRLASALNQALRGQLTGEPSIGFHVTGYEPMDTGSVPTFFHVHDGYSDIFTDVNPRQVNAHHDCPPDYLRKLLHGGRHQEMRNGEFRSYAIVRDALGKAFDHLQSIGWPSLTFGSLRDVTGYNVAEIRLMSDIYALYGKPVIGGRVDSLAIPESGEIAVGAHHNTSGATSAIEFTGDVGPCSLNAVNDHGRSGYVPQMAPPFIPQTNHIAISGWTPPKQS